MFHNLAGQNDVQWRVSIHIHYLQTSSITYEALYAADIALLRCYVQCSFICSQGWLVQLAHTLKTKVMVGGRPLG